jgi:hypothetical protein
MRGLVSFIAVVLVITVAAVSVEYIPPVHHWMLHVSGSDDVSGPEYGWWSGFGSVFPWSMGILAGIWTHAVQNARKSNCHTHGCWRIGSYPVGDSNYKVCKRCHFKITGVHPTIEHLRFHHQVAVRKRLRDAGFPPKD